MKNSLLFLLAFVLFGCDVSFNDGKILEYKKPHREWTFIVYMAADNDLEQQAIEDFNEIEAANLSGKSATVLVLFDRTVGYDSTNGDWTDTRLFEVTSDPNGSNSTIVSKRLDCPILGLSATSNTELNMANPLVLSRLIDFAKTEYTADNYGLIVWGHGLGWRGVAIEDNAGTNTNMSLSEFGGAINGKGLNVVGFDTCLGAELEVVYQIKDSADFFVGSAGITLSDGWNYKNLFTSFLAIETPTASDFCDCVIAQFKNEYGGDATATISKIDLSKVSDVFTAFENFVEALAQRVVSTATKNAILTPISDEAIDVYRFAPPAELYIDLYSFSEKMKSIHPDITTDGNTLQSALDAAVPSSWSNKYGTARRQMGVFFIELANSRSFESNHPIGYRKGSGVAYQSAFVNASNHWVPNATPSSVSLLDKLFYFGY